MVMRARVLAALVALLWTETALLSVTTAASAAPNDLPPPPLPPPGQTSGQPSPGGEPGGELAGAEPSRPPPPRYAPHAPRPAPPPYEEHIPPASTPLPRRGFQLALRAAVALPLGESVENRGLGETWGPQFVTWLDIGGKPIPHIFVGGYVASGFGGISDDVARCGGRGCTGYNVRFGAQVQYHFEPAAKADPWIGYGIGWELAYVNAPRGAGPSYELSGPELAHFMGGLDFRLTRTFGVGPYADFALGTYTKNDVGSIADTAFHQWLVLGAKFTFFP